MQSGNKRGRQGRAGNRVAVVLVAALVVFLLFRVFYGQIETGLSSVFGSGSAS
jgi:hypothetical protein